VTPLFAELAVWVGWSWPKRGGFWGLARH